MTYTSRSGYTAVSPLRIVGFEATVVTMPAPEFHGLLVLDKPLGITSRDAVDRAARWFPRGARVGHTGTLDPLATGVLVLCVGHATRLTEYVQAMGKTYEADMVLGARSATDDAEGPIITVTVERPPTAAVVGACLSSFVGEVVQVPPAFSAAKVAGRRAYDLARRGAGVVLAPRTVRIDTIDVLEYDYPHLRLRVRCGKGTYIRSLARDLGDRLGCGGYLAGLRRTAVGRFSSDGAVAQDADAATARERLLPPLAAVAELPRVILPPTEVDRLRHGQGVELGESGHPLPDARPGRELAVVDQLGALVAVATVDATGQVMRPSKVFPA
jgi:tRNA pseudouridine55 synthase